MSLYQRRLSSSTHAMRHSLENRARRLEDELKRAQELIHQAPPILPSPDDLEEMEDTERDHLEKTLEAIQDPARFPWHEVTKVQHYWLEVSGMTKPMSVREDNGHYGGQKP